MIELLGVKPSVVIGGIIGGVISLSFIRILSPLQAVLAVITGAATAIYATPVIVEWFELTGSSENGVAFLIGLIGMNILAGIVKISEFFKNSPLKTINDLKNIKITIGTKDDDK